MCVWVCGCVCVWEDGRGEEGRVREENLFFNDQTIVIVKSFLLDYNYDDKQK